MPLITLTAAKSAMAGKNNNTNYSGARTASTSDYATLNTNSSNILAQNFYRNALRGAATFRFGRAFFAYDFTGYGTAAGTMTNLKWNFNGTNNTNSSTSTRLVKSSAFGSGVGSNYVSSNWWSSLTVGTTYNSSAAANSTWSTGTSNQSWTLSSNATTAAQTDGFLKFATMNALWDYSGNIPGLDVDQLNYLNNSLLLGITRAKITFDWTPAATGWSGEINSVSSSAIDEINSVSISTIEEINTVS